MTIWFERLTVVQLFLLLARRLADRDIEAYFASASRPAAGILRYFSAAFPRVHEQELVLGVREESGEALCYKANELTVAVATRVFDEYFSGTDYLPADLKEHASRVHRAFKAYCISAFRRKIAFLCAAEHASSTVLSQKGKRARYHLTPVSLHRPFVDAASLFFKGEIRCAFSPIAAIRDSLPARLLGFLAGIFTRQKGAASRAQLAADARSKVLIEFSRYKFGNEDYNFLFWFPKSGIEPGRVVMGFDRPDSPCSGENIALVEQRGMRWLDLKKNALMAHLRLSEWTALFWAALTSVPLPRGARGVRLWRWKTMLEFAFFVRVWRAIFKKYGIRVMHQHQEHDFWSHIQSLALDLEGGFYFWFHWSIQRIPLPHFNAGYCDVFFSWGKVHRDYLDMHDFEYRYMLDTGLIWDYLCERDHAGHSGFTQGMDTGVDFVIALFDVGSNPGTEFSPYLESIFYRSMLQAVAAHPRWGVVIKSKHGIGHLPRRQEIQGQIDLLTRQKRCVYLAPEEAPSAAFQHADVCVCHGINTAGAIAALCGKKAIHWDLAAERRHPYYFDGLGKFVFETEEEVIRALESLAGQGNSQSPLGDHSAWLGHLDAYRDGVGGMRAGQFIRSFLDLKDAGLGGEAALQKAVAGFRERWGNDRVCPFEGKNERLKDNIWLKAEQVLKKQ